MAIKRNPIARRALGMLTRGFAAVTRAVPLPVARMLGRYLGRAAFHVIPRVRRVALANIEMAYGDSLSPGEKREIARSATENVGIVAAEFTRIPKLKDPRFLSRSVKIVGDDRLREGGGRLLVGCHLGNWEWMAPVVSAIGIPIAEVVRPLDDPRLNALVDATRRAGGVITIPKSGAGSEILRLLREGTCVGVLADQSPGSNAVPVTFFGHPCWATIAPIMVAMRAKVPIHLLHMHRNPDATYTFDIGPEIVTVRTGDFYEDLRVNSQRIQDALEALVRAHPHQWLWLHRRWKERPRLANEWAERTRKAKAVAPISEEQTPQE